MGIRVNCPQCGKQLNVKSFLAGKRGVCPECGSKFDIPASAGGGHTVLHVEDESPAEASQPDVAAVPQPLPPSAAAGAEASPAGGASPVAPTEFPAAAAAPVIAPAPVGTAGYAAPAAIPAPGVVPGTHMAGAPPVMAAAPMASMAGVPVGADPLSPAFQTSWHVCLPDGNQYGPVASDALRQWIAERRVTSDSLLWCEGWAAWQRADAVLPHFFTPYPAATIPAAPVPAAMPSMGVPAEAAFPAAQSGLSISAEPARVVLSRRKARRSQGMRVFMLALLVVAVLILAPVLGYVLFKQF